MPCATTTHATALQTLTGQANIRIMGIGGTAEKIIASSLKQTYGNLPEVVDRWMAFRKEVKRVLNVSGRQYLSMHGPGSPWLGALAIPCACCCHTAVTQNGTHGLAVSEHNAPPIPLLPPCALLAQSFGVLAWVRARDYASLQPVNCLFCVRCADVRWFLVMCTTASGAWWLRSAAGWSARHQGLSQRGPGCAQGEATPVG